MKPALRTLFALLLVLLIVPSALAGPRGHKKRDQSSQSPPEPAPQTAQEDLAEIAPTAETTPQEIDIRAERERLLDLARAAANLEESYHQHEVEEAVEDREISDPELLARLLEARRQGVGTNQWQDFLDEVLGDRPSPRLAKRFPVSRVDLGPVWIDPRLDWFQDPMAAIARHEKLRPDLIDPGMFDYPIIVNERVSAWMEYFLDTGEKWFRVWAGRLPRFQAIIDPSLAKAGLPRDLLYQSMIESGFSTGATSRVGAGGIWQFMPRTGQRFGLRQDYWIDQRRDPWLATEAAIGYLTYLYAEFGSWWLASAAYNAGEGKIARAIERYGSNDFWVLCRGDYLKPETKNYVPKMMASAILHRYLDRYGLADQVRLEEPWHVEALTVDGAVDIERIASFAGVKEADLKVYNPALLRFATPPDGGATLIHVPLGTAQKVAESIASIPPAERVSYATYTVRSGDVLSKIARNHGTTTAMITKLNNIKNPRSLRIGQVLVLPIKSGTVQDRINDPQPKPVVAKRPSTTVSKPVAATRSTTTTSHIVVSGDTLSGIASRYGISISDIRSWNKLDGDLIKIGQSLRVQEPPPTTVTVRSGDTIWGIAARIGVSVNQILDWNGLSENSVIHPGQILTLKIQ